MDFSGIRFAPEWMVALPFGVALLGFFILSNAIKGEAEKYDVEERSHLEAARHYRPSRRKIARKLASHAA